MLFLRIFIFLKKSYCINLIFFHKYSFDGFRYLKDEGIMEEEESKKLFWFVDSTGLITSHRKDKMAPEKKKYLVIYSTNKRYI